MRQIDEDLNPFFDYVVGFLAFNIGHKTHTARIVLIARVVKTLRLRQSWHCRLLGRGIFFPFIHNHTWLVSQY